MTKKLHSDAAHVLPALLAALIFVVAFPAHAQSQPCSSTGEPGIPACADNTAYSKPITLERVFGDDFESGIKWEKKGSITEYKGIPREGTRAVMLRQNGSITKAVSLANKGNHVLITFKMGAYSLETKKDERPTPPPPVADKAEPSAPVSRKNESVNAEYYDGKTWVPLATIANGSAAEDQALHTYASYIPSLSNPSTFKLRFRIDGSDQQDYGYVDDVAIWAARIMPPPVPLPR